MTTKNIDWEKPLMCEAGEVYLPDVKLTGLHGRRVVSLRNQPGLVWEVTKRNGVPMVGQLLGSTFIVFNQPTARDKVIDSITDMQTGKRYLSPAKIADHLISNGFINED